MFRYDKPYVVNPGAAAGSLEAKRPPVDNGLDVPSPERYSSPEFMAREWRGLWPRVWLLAGVSSDIPEPGDYTVFDIGHESIVLVRQKDGGIRAFFNVCPHRGNKIALSEFGSVDRFTCAFHGWKFCTDGRLDQITDEESFHPELVRRRPGLSEVRCDSVGGLIFVNMDGQAPALRDWIGLPKGYIENYEIDKMNVVRHVRTEWHGNWKVGVDAFYETYHLPHIHPQTQGVMEDFSQYDLYPNGFSRMIVPICTKSHRIADQETVAPDLQYMMREAGMDPAEYHGSAKDVRAAVQQAKRARARRLGLAHYERFSDGQLTDSWATGLFPNVQIGMHPEGVFIMRFLPHATDPERFYYDNLTLYRYVDDPNYFVPGWMGLPKDTDVTGATRPPIEHYGIEQRADLGPVLNQDVELVAAVQRGSRSRGFKGPLWSEQECRVRHFHRELDRVLKDVK
ncbi:MAG: aromatic ring-hydroxylating dioxygenase subunit alpha [Proteobacteria bacterium]|nr:aromatic ring-hydroxylating dioxygenase subunit alpha [Pseudomonadota bacterium]